MSEFKLYAVRVFTFDWDTSVAFFKDVVQLPLTFSDADLGWAQFDLGGAFLGVERCDKEDPEATGLVGRFVGVSLEVTDMQATYERLSALDVVFTAEPEKQPWGATLAHFEDPDGNVFTLLGN